MPFEGPTAVPPDPRQPEERGSLLVTVPDAAALLAVSRSKMYEVIGEGNIATVEIGRARRVWVRDLLAYIEEHRGYAR